MKPFLIDLENVESWVDAGLEIELQASMNVRPEPEPLADVHQSRLRMSRSTARQLCAELTELLSRPPR